MALSNDKKVQLTAELNRKKYYELLERERVHIEEKNKSGHLTRLLQIQRKEQEDANTIQQTKQQAAYKEKVLNQEETLAQQFEKMKRHDIREIRERQLLRENSEELRELEAKLRAAYVARELQAQIAEKEALKLEEKFKEIENTRALQKARVSDEEFKHKLKKEEMEKKYQYKIDLQHQMITQEKMRRYKYEEFLKEKKLIDEIVERIHLEDERSWKEKWCKIQKTRAEMEAFKEAQAVWRQKEKEEIEMENQRIQEYMFTKQSNFAELAAEKKKKEKMRTEIHNKIAQKIYEARSKQKERDDIQMELLEQECMEASDLRVQRELEKKFRQRIDMTAGLAKQLDEKDDKRKEIEQEEEEFNKLMLARQAEEEKLELLTSEKRRIKKIQFRKDLIDLMAQRRQKRAEDMQILLKIHEDDLSNIADRKRRIETERIRMLKEHAFNLIGYLPSGVLRNEDLPILGGEIEKAYTKYG